MVSYDALLFQELTAGLNMPKGFSLVTERATGRVLFSPLMEESTVSKFDALLRALSQALALHARLQVRYSRLFFTGVLILILIIKSE